MVIGYSNLKMTFVIMTHVNGIKLGSQRVFEIFSLVIRIQNSLT